MIPFLSSGRGGSHVSLMLLELMATTCTFVGVPEGTAVMEEYPCRLSNESSAFTDLLTYFAYHLVEFAVKGLH